MIAKVTDHDRILIGTYGSAIQELLSTIPATICVIYSATNFVSAH
ncbi:hypothetical protein C5L28_000252 [Lentilactobacillus parakefiri]|uniref:Uncharacterized protein n=1 Tax=Lentilactobacillus parakefiri TaxID=152332 RepID=A0A224VIF4_9LACO|nr:hypothetical protein C5L28_000252 [Lentilactobacillus parakefiri]GAW72054.1 hypothetical protein LPKJCM_01162 [Lentilactobacillus parakefiri]